jgi:hypothetical protein
LFSIEVVKQEQVKKKEAPLKIAQKPTPFISKKVVKKRHAKKKYEIF